MQHLVAIGLVRLEIESIGTVSFGLGVLARLGLVSVFRRAVTAEFSNYRKFDVDTSTTYAPPKPSSR